jgi:hypothetical protein
VTVAPAISGRLTDDAGVPVAGARVALSTGMGDQRCIDPIATTTTDAEGRYAFSRIRRIQWFMPLYGDWFHMYHVCGGGKPLRSGMMADAAPEMGAVECGDAAAKGGAPECRQSPAPPAKNDRPRADTTRAPRP